MTISTSLPIGVEAHDLYQVLVVLDALTVKLEDHIVALQARCRGGSSRVTRVTMRRGHWASRADGWRFGRAESVVEPTPRSGAWDAPVRPTAGRPKWPC